MGFTYTRFSKRHLHILLTYITSPCAVLRRGSSKAKKVVSHTTTFPLFRYRAIYQNTPLPIFGDFFASKHLPCSVVIHVTPMTSRQASHASGCHRTVLACNWDQVTWSTICFTMTAPGFLDRSGPQLPESSPDLNSLSLVPVHLAAARHVHHR